MTLAMTDAFADTVNDALRRLGNSEGGSVSINELARRTGVPRATLHYHLNGKRASEGRRIPRDLVAKLAQVLPISEADLMRAAQVASGYQVRESGEDLPDMRGTVVRYLESADNREGRLAVLAELQRITAEEMSRVLSGENENESR